MIRNNPIYKTLFKCSQLRFAGKLVVGIEIAIFVFIVLYGYVILVMGTYYTYPGAEDYEVSCISRDVGVVNSVLETLTNYDGRYTTNVLHAINPLVFNWIRGYALMNLAGVLLMQLGLYLFMSVFIKTKNKQLIFLYSALVIVTYMGCISCFATFYQMTGNFVYLYPGAFVLFFLTALTRYFETKKRLGKNIYFLLTVSLLVIGIGFLELYLMFYFILITGILFYAWRTDRMLLSNFLPIFFVGVSSMLFFALAPGANVHLTTMRENITVISAFNVFLNSVKNYGVAFISTLVKPICIGSIVYGVILFKTEIFVGRKYFSHKNIFLFFLAIIAVTFLMTLLYYFPTLDNTSNPEKIYTPVLFLLFVFVFVFVCSAVPLPSALLKPRLLPFVKIILLLAVLGNFISGDNNMSALIIDYRSGRLQEFKIFMDKRITLLSNVSQSNMPYKIVCTPALVDYPHSIYNPLDKETDRTTSKWNKCHEEYFRIDEVTTEEDSMRKFR